MPDSYWRLEPGVQLDPENEKQWAKAIELFGAFDLDSGVEDLKATLSFLLQYPSSTGKVGSVGFCMGGKLPYFMATRTDADAKVAENNWKIAKTGYEVAATVFTEEDFPEQWNFIQNKSALIYQLNYCNLFPKVQVKFELILYLNKSESNLRSILLK